MSLAARITQAAASSQRTRGGVTRNRRPKAHFSAAGPQHVPTKTTAKIPPNQGDTAPSPFHAASYSRTNSGGRGLAAAIAGRKACGSGAASHAGDVQSPNSLEYANR